MPNLFTQYSEDTCRLPEDTTRIGYDADTSRYLFRDTSGQLYESDPHEEYGLLTPVDAPNPPRRNVSITRVRDPRLPTDFSPTPAKTFNDFLPAAFIVAAPAPDPSDDNLDSNIDSDVNTNYADYDIKSSYSDYKYDGGNGNGNTLKRITSTIRHVPQLKTIVDGVISRSKSVARRGNKIETREREQEKYADEKSKYGNGSVDSDAGLDEYGPPPYTPREQDWEVL